VEDDEAEEEGKANFDTSIMPEFVVALEATDEFLKNRVMNLPEALVAGTHNTEKELLRRLDVYKDANREDETVLNYFDELEFHPERIGWFSKFLISFLVFCSLFVSGFVEAGIQTSLSFFLFCSLFSYHALCGLF
jgi:hypothetical protein